LSGHRRVGPFVFAAMLVGLACVLHPGESAAQQQSIDRSGLEAEPAMRTLLEKTIFKVDVAWLDIWFTPGVGQRLRSLASRRPGSARDSIARVALDATDVLARLTFERDVGVDRFLDGLVTSTEKARDAGIITDAMLRDIRTSSSQWYAPLEARGIRDGDEMLYRIRGDTLRTVVRSADGTTLLDQTDVGPERRLAVLGGYLAPGGDFRDGLIDSVLNGGR
jgi:hypothetical protein